MRGACTFRVEDDPCVGIYARKTILAHKLAQLLAHPFPINLHKSFNTNASIFNFGAPITRKCANLGVSWRNYPFPTHHGPTIH